MYILGISAYYHDSAAVLMHDEKIVAAVQEERFSRVKHDPEFPINAVQYCLKEAQITLDDIDFIAFYDKPFVKFERLVETYLAEAPSGFKQFLKSIPVWLKKKLFLRETLAREFITLFKRIDPDATPQQIKAFRSAIESKFMFGEHHLSHAASAFYPSPFEEAAILTIDGVGEWVTTSIAHGKNNKIEILAEVHFPHSVGLLYSAMTYYTGFKVNSGEYKIMGLAPYGQPIYADLIMQHIVDIKADGSFKLDMSYFNYTTGMTMTTDKFHTLFGGQPKRPNSKVTQREMDLAASVQCVVEDIVLKQAKHAQQITQSKNLCLAGGVALNCVANGKLLESGQFDNIWIQPAAGDAGGALGVAGSVYYQELDNQRTIDENQPDKMQGAYLGPEDSDEEIAAYLEKIGAKYHYIEDEVSLIQHTSDALVAEKVVGWHQGRMEFGPRSLGNRSILGDARSAKMQSTINLKIKFRESFRPFAPAVLSEKASQWFNINVKSPYMLFVASIKQSARLETTATPQQKDLSGLDMLKVQRSTLPAITHVDYSARIQTVHHDTNKRFHQLISAFEAKTGSPVLVNTSFNVRGEPIVCTPEDSYRCFMRTNMDVLVIGNYFLTKSEQPVGTDLASGNINFELD